MTFSTVDKRLGHLEGRFFVIETDLYIQILAANIHQFRHRYAAGAHVLDHPLGMQFSGEDQAVDVVREQIQNLAFFTLGVIFVVGDQRLVLASRGDGFNSRQHVGKDLITKRGDQHTNSFATCVEQNFRSAVRNVVVLFHDFRNQFTAALRHLIRVTQITADRHLIQTGQISDIL
ncbi:hypothetical protein SDC9_147166 [bioreactor metagenome]|uniref:Uncharacterized protein n=1 Tax=bioreactor metagenome TaxID=1076179 RepID=A0A645EFA4_9ZZZZ